MVTMLWMLAAAHAGSAESTWAKFASIANLEAEASSVRPLEAPLEIQEGPATYRLTGGYLVPVFGGRAGSTWDRDRRKLQQQQREAGLDVRVPTEEERGDRELVGVLWTGGTGTLTLEFPDRADGLVLANRITMAGHAAPGALRDLAHDKAPLRVKVTELAWLSVDPAIDAAFAGPSHLDPYELVVFGASKEAERAAETVIRRIEARLELLRRQRISVANRVAWDRMDQASGVVGPQGTFALVEALTDQRFATVAPNQTGPADRWLSTVRDETGAIDLRRRVRVSARGISGRGVPVDGTISGELFPRIDPSDPTSAPLPPVRPVGVSVLTDLATVPEGPHVRAEITSDLTFRAQGGPLSRITLQLAQAGLDLDAFEVVDARLMDGTPLLGQQAQTITETAPAPKPEPDPEPDPDPAPTPQPDPEPQDAPDVLRYGLIDLLLPEPVPVGETVKVRLQHRDLWPITQTQASYTGLRDMGPSSGLQWPLPTVVPGPVGGEWSWDITARMPTDTKWTAALPGATVGQDQREGWTRIRARSEGKGRYPGVVLGRFDVREIPAQAGMPAVRVNLFADHYGSIDTFAPEVRRIASFFQGFLPKFPVTELEVVESPRQHEGFVWIAPHGMAVIQRMLVMGTMREGGPNIRNRLPRLESSVFAHELAHQYWGHLAPAASSEDFWISETFAEAFSCMYVGTAYKAKDCTKRMKLHRETWTRRKESLIRASLTQAYETPLEQPNIVYRYGPVTMLDGLQRKLGPQAFFAALDLMLRNHAGEPTTTERLQHYLEQASGIDLEDWFAYFVHGGYVPTLSAKWQVERKTVSGTVTSNVPYGTFDALVRITTKDGTVTNHFVPVVDGQGQFSVPVSQAKVKVEVDPVGLIVMRGGRTRQVR